MSQAPPPPPGAAVRTLLAAAAGALSSTQAKAAVLSGGITASAASAAQADPLPWLVSALGALVVLVKFPAGSKAQGIGNAVVSVLLGGLGCEFAAQYIDRLTGVDPGSLLMAFALSAAWPAAVGAVQQLWPALRRRLDAKIGGQ